MSAAPAAGWLAPPPEEETGEVRAADGARLHYRAWPVRAPRAAVFLSHGLGEHGGRYEPLARDLAPRGISLYAVDHRGHGRSGGQRGHVRRFGVYVDDLERFRRRVAALVPGGTPLFLLGHSLGGLIALRWLQAHADAPLAGAVLSAPLLGVKVRAPRWKLALSRVLSRTIPNLPFSSEIDPADLSSDPAYVRSYREDPLVHARITPRLYQEFMAAIAAAMGEGTAFRMPLLFLVPEADPVVDPAAVLAYAASLRPAPEVRRYPGFRHESLNEAERARAVADVAAWMEARLGSA